MKNIILGIFLLTILSCKKEAKKVDNRIVNDIEAVTKDTSLKTIVGEFLYYTDAAVFKTKTDVYGVLLDANAQKLIEAAKPYKKEATDMVWVKIKGKIVPKATQDEGWPFNIEIKEIIEVKPLTTDDNIIIKNN